MERHSVRLGSPERPTNIATTPHTPKSSPKSPKSSRPSRSPRSPRTPSSPDSKSPRNPENSLWIHGMQRRKFLEHLSKWSLSHDSSSHFHGTISVCEKPNSTQSFKLGISVNCILTDKAWAGPRKRIIIRLFAPQEEGGRYRLVVRSGAGWVTAKEFFNHEYFHLRRIDHRKSRFISPRHVEVGGALQSRSDLLGPTPGEKDAIIIRPLFRSFLRLPLEIQEMILGIAMNKTELFQPAWAQHSGFGIYSSSGRLVVVPADVPLLSVFRLSKALSYHIVPWIYRSTTFHFETSGFTNFLWQAGPINRTYINKITLAFGAAAILHCIRWLAPEPIFELFNPPMATEPPALQYLWRCQIQDLAKELHLSLLTIDISDIPAADIPFVVRTLCQCFGSLEKIRLTSSGVEVGEDDARLAGLKKHQTWAELCKGAFSNYKENNWYMGKKLRNMSVDALHWEMKKNGDFFHRMSDKEPMRPPVAS